MVLPFPSVHIAPAGSRPMASGASDIKSLFGKKKKVSKHGRGKCVTFGNIQRILLRYSQCMGLIKSRDY